MKDVFGVIIDRIWISCCILQCKHIMMVCFLHFQLYFWKWWSKKTLFCLSILLDAHFSTEFVPTLIQISEIWNISKCESFFQTKLSSPPVAGVWWAHWRRCPVAAVASSKWMLHTGGDWGETPPPPPHMIVKRFGCTTIHNKSAIQINHSFIPEKLFTLMKLTVGCAITFFS